ncbi:MAG: glycoside hydrolase family 25 protein [Polyangia bacterium]|jgi:GH25 family lysozyme M1 (1,4-beta-N-acetylmuramidase)|nr:glycoside hydrolase family 25 protein [Polyangia bacterium]
MMVKDHGAPLWRCAALAPFLAVLGACVEQPVDYEQVEEAAVVCPSGTTLPGIDVSTWQGAINWDQVAAAGIRFAIIRVSDGTTYPDSRFAYNWSEARRVGITRGAYQFFRPNQNAVAQANLLLNMMGTLQPGDLPPTIDVEATGGMSPSAIASGIQQWISTVQSATGTRPIIYTGKYFWQDYVQSSAFSGYPLWIANWGVTCPNIPDQWSTWVFHQYTDSGTVSGISGYVDRNRFNGDAAALAAFTVSNCQCSVGQTQTQACGNCGTQTRTCLGSCQWGAWSTCQGQGVCRPGTTEQQSCCDCGSQARICGGDCQWQAWSSCAGPDPSGGTQRCDTGEPGPCAEGRVRCVQGCLECVRAVEPEPERCDLVDNDCNGLLNDGDPTIMGEPPPAWAAHLVDISLPMSLQPGERSMGWVTFRNVGSEAWPPHEIWLVSERARQGQASELHHESWPAYDVAALSDGLVSPGELLTLEIPLAMPEDAREMAAESFRLEDPFGVPFACPSPGFRAEIRVSLRAAPMAEAELPSERIATGPLLGAQSGCNCSASKGSGWHGIPFVLLFLTCVFRRRTRRCGQE